MNIANNDMYYLSVNIENRESFLAEGIAITKYEDPSYENWGTACWFDKISATTRTIEITKEPQLEGKNITVVSSEDLIYTFAFVTQEIYENTIAKRLPNPPELGDDATVQHYLKSLNPYE